MTGILQRYVGLELFKAFGLATVALIMLLTLCGGVAGMVRADLLGAADMMQLLILSVPIAGTIAIPIAGLFACAIVYGRFAMDNEFDACKASGINILTLLMPALMLSIFTAAITFALSNFLLPHMFRSLEAMLRADGDKILVSALKSRKHFAFGKYVLYAEHITEAEDDDGTTMVVAENSAYMMFDEDNLAVVGTAKGLNLNFRPDKKSGTPVIVAELMQPRVFDLTRLTVVEEEQQAFTPLQFTRTTPLKAKWLDLLELVAYRNDPALLSGTQEDLAHIRQILRGAMFYDDVFTQVKANKGKLVLSDENNTYRITAKSFRPPGPKDLAIKLVDVTVETLVDGEARHFTAGQLSMSVETIDYLKELDAVRISLENKVSWYRASDPGKVVANDRYDFPPISIATTFRDKANSYTAADLLGNDYASPLDLPTDETALAEQLPPMQLGDHLRNKRIDARNELAYQIRDMGAELHSRLALCSSMFVTLILAATLGIIFRGGQLMTAFGIAFIPGLFIFVMNITGRQLAEKTGMHLTGISITWLALVIVALTDVVVFRRYLKR